MGLHERNSHPLDCQLRSQIQWSKKSEPPWKGGPAMTMRKQKGQGAASKHAITDKKSNGGSFIGEMQPSVVWAQSAAYLPVSAKLNNMQRKLECKNCHCICHSTSAGASKKAGSQEIPTAELFRTCQDVIVPEGPAVRCSTYQKTL